MLLLLALAAERQNVGQTETMPSEQNTPDVAAVAACVARMADAMNLRSPEPQQAKAFLTRLLDVDAPHDGGRNFWPCFVEGLITETETRNAVMAHVATWIAHTNGVDEPSYDTYGSRALELGFDLAFFGRPARSP